ncbi:MAG TPA: PaaI family thioesterase [Ktedonobacterales bacterium]|nr:PaaI family thioesterase [Ktedonobacterales bacterium]
MNPPEDPTPRVRRFPPPIAELLGMTLTSSGDGHAIMEMDASERHTNPMGTLHGGVLCDLADAAMGAAFGSTLAEGESFTTLELKINFLKPVWNAHLVARGRIVRRGRTVSMIECDVTDETGALVARASSTCLTLRAERAAGR